MKILSEREHTEEVHDLITDIPNSYNKWITIISLSFFTLIIIASFIIQYPDIVVGQIKIVAINPPVTLVSNSTGELHLFQNAKSKARVSKDEYLAVIDNAAVTSDVLTLKEFIAKNELNELNTNIELDFPNKLLLGEIEGKYYAFLNAYEEYHHFIFYNEFDLEIKYLQEQILDVNSSLVKKDEIIQLNDKSTYLYNHLFKTDSLLKAEGVISESKYIQAELFHIEKVENNKKLKVDYLADKLHLLESNYRMNELKRQKDERKEHLELDMVISYNELLTSISNWERKYVIKSPVDGTLEYLNFLKENQFIEAGNKLFSVLPDNTEFIGQILVPIEGAGQVEIGQRVNIKLQSFNYQDYGMVEGQIESISLIASENNYLNTVKLPTGLMSNLGKSLFLSNEMTGTAEIITEDKRIWDRLFNKARALIVSN